MPEPSTIERARRDARKGKSASTQAGEFVREEIHRVRRGQHGARSAKQIIAIGLSQARRAGVKFPPPASGTASPATRHKAELDLAQGSRGQKPSPERSRARLKAMRKESREAASTAALSRQTREAARRRGPTARSQAAQKAARTRARAA